MLSNDNYFLYIKAYLKRNGIDWDDSWVCDFLIDAGTGVVEVNAERWPFANVAIPTPEQLNAIPEAEVENFNIKYGRVELDVYSELPTGKYREGTLIIVNNSTEYALYVYLDSQFRLL